MVDDFVHLRVTAWGVIVPSAFWDGLDHAQELAGSAGIGDLSESRTERNPPSDGAASDFGVRPADNSQG